MIEIDDIHKARERIAPYVERTLLGKNAVLSQRLETNIYLKLEIFQKTGSFKPRGAFNQILQLSEDQRQAGLVAISGGDFAQGVAYAGQVLGLRTRICMPSYTPRHYIRATQAYGAQVELASTFQEAEALAQAYQSQGSIFLHPYDNLNQMAGNGTIALELLEDLPELTDVIVSIGGGGLLAGILAAINALKPHVRVWGVETEGADSLGQALNAGRVIHIHPTSLAKTLGAPYVAADALALAQQYLAGYVLVSDREAITAQLVLLERVKVLTELAASCTLAAADRLKDRFKPTDQVVLLLCGGNTSLEDLLAYHQTGSQK